LAEVHFSVFGVYFLAGVECCR